MRFKGSLNKGGKSNKIHKDNVDRDQAREELGKDLAEHMESAFNQMNKQLEEREQLLKARLKSIDKTHSNQLTRVKLMSLPVMLLSIIAVVYLFYVVRVMETAMTSMSADMTRMTAHFEVVTE